MDDICDILGDTLYGWLKDALTEYPKHLTAHRELTERLPAEVVSRWEELEQAWHKDHTEDVIMGQKPFEAYITNFRACRCLSRQPYVQPAQALK